MWPSTLEDSSFRFPLLSPPPPPPPLPPFQLGMLLRNLALPGFNFSQPPAPTEAVLCPSISPPHQLESNVDFAFSFIPQPLNIFSVPNELEGKHQHSYGHKEALTSRKTKRLYKLPRSDNESASKKCKKISATALNDTTEHIEDIRRFARAFKMKRLSLGLTQTQIGRALTAGDGPAYSQSAICRFEKLDITPKSAQRIKPVLEHWLAELEGRQVVDVAGPHLTSLGDRSSACGSVGSSHEDVGPYRVDCESDGSSAGLRKRKTRTNFSADALDRLNNEFNINMHPSGTRISQIANQLNYDREVIRVWFCNKRQSCRNNNNNNNSNNQSAGGGRLGEHTAPWVFSSGASEDEAPVDLSIKASFFK